MPLSELYRLAKGKVESSLQETAAGSVNPSSVSYNDFLELIWENGQIFMHGQSSKGRKPSGVNNLPVTALDLPSHSPKSREKDSGNGLNLKGGKFGNSVLNDFPLSVPSDEMGDDEMVTWLNYPIDDQLNQDYCSDLLSELSGVAMNDLPIHNNLSSESKRISANEANPNMISASSHTGVCSEQENSFKVVMSGGCPTASESSLVHPISSSQCHTSFASFRSRISDVANCTSNSNQNGSSADISHIQGSSNVLPSIRMQKHDQGPSASNTNIMNFSHFSRPVAIVKANLESIGARGSPQPASSDRMPNKDKGSILTSVECPCEPSFRDSGGALEKDVGSHSQPIAVVANEGSKLSTNEVLEVEYAADPSDHRCGENGYMAEKSSNQIPSTAANKAIADGDKNIEPAVASSVCSGNSAERASNDPMQNVKRKRCDTEDMEYPSDGIDEDSVGVKKAPPPRGGTGSKRTRAAEVHNLSERRRRDRINEKMRALQELIPNCNKVDKASMLDEAIEYLKSLQLQLQMMSMGAGMCVPPMMLPSGLQHMHPAHMPRFSHMGAGMGMGYGMSMMDMNGGAPGCSVMQIPHMQGSRFPGPPISGMSNLHGMPVSSLPMFGLNGQGLSMSLPHAPLFSFPGAASTRPTGNLGSSQTSNSKQPINPQMVQSIDVNGLHGPTETKFSETKEVGEQAASVQNNDQVPDVNCHRAIN